MVTDLAILYIYIFSIWSRNQTLIDAWFLQWNLSLWLFNVLSNLWKLLSSTILAYIVYKSCIYAVEAVSCSDWKKFDIYRYFIYNYIKTLYALLVKASKYINTQVPTNPCNFESLRNLLELNFRFYVIYLEVHSVKISYLHEKNY